MSPLVIPIVAMFIPIVAIAGGLTVAVFRTRGQQRIAELVMKERIAAIEKGIDPATLPPAPTVADPGELRVEALDPMQRSRRCAQGLLIGGVITTAAGLGLCAMLYALPQVSHLGVWVVGLLPIFVGLGLLIASWLVGARHATAA